MKPQTLWSTVFPCLHEVLTQGWNKVCRSSQPISEFTKGPRHRMEPIPKMLGWSRTWDQTGTSGKIKYHYSYKTTTTKVTIKNFPNDFLLYSLIGTLINHHQRHFPLQQRGTISVTHSLILCRKIKEASLST